MKKHSSLRKVGKQTLHKKAWKVFSAWIRQRDPNCVTCGAKTTQAGHFYHGVLDFDPMNVHGQCVQCNHYKSGNLAEYATFLIENYGIVEFNKLKTRKYKALAGEKRTDEDYQEIINKYK